MAGEWSPKSLTPRLASRGDGAADESYVLYHGAHHDDVPGILTSGLRGDPGQPTVTTSREGAELYGQKRDWTAPKVLEIHVPRSQAHRYLGEAQEGLPVEGTVHALRETLPPSFIRAVHEASRPPKTAAHGSSYGWDDDETYALNHPESVEEPPSASEEYWNPPHLYHGTSAELRPGDMAEGGHPSNFDKPKGRLDHAYATPHVSTAADYAETAAYRRGGHPRVYEVDRAHDMLPDPETGAAFGGSSETLKQPDWRSKSGFRVLRELHPSEFEHHLTEDWPGLGEHTAATHVGPWYHGTYRDFSPGEFVRPGQDPSFGTRDEVVSNQPVYMSNNQHAAGAWAEEAVDSRRRRGEDASAMRPRVYEVHPTGHHFVDDSNEAEHTPDYIDHASDHPLQVVREVPFDVSLAPWRHPDYVPNEPLTRKSSRWSPSAGIFGPTTGLDPHLFDEGGELRGQVRHDLMTRLDQCLRVDSGLAGSDWQEWLHVYLAGGSASEWAGSRPNDAAQDLDVIVAIDLAEAQGYSSFEGMNGGEAASALNAAFWRHFNADGWQPGFGGTWNLTAFCNQRAQGGIEAIKPYAAYDVTGMRWAVSPPHLPEHTVADFSPAVTQMARAVAAQARAILRMDEPVRTREARALWDRVHADRSAAFSDQGDGWQDAGNLVEKWLAYAPHGLLGKIRDLAMAKTAAYTPASASGYGASRPRGGFGKGRKHWSQPPEQRTGQPGEHMYRFQSAEFHDQTMREGIAPRQSAGHLPDDPDQTVYMASDDHVFHASPGSGHPGTPEWLQSHGDNEYHRHYKIDVSGLPLVEDRTYTNPETGQKRAWMATEHIGPERIQPHLPGSEHGVTYDMPDGSKREWKPSVASKTAAQENPSCCYCGEPLDDEDVRDGQSAHEECSDMRWCEACQEHHDDPQETEDHNEAYTDWGNHLPFRGGIHRGITVRLPPEVHAVVHDEARPHAERATALARHLHENPADYSDDRGYAGGYGVHWTDHEPVAQAWGSGDGAMFGPSEEERHGRDFTHVVMHAASPDEDHIETDPRVLSGRNLLGFDHGRSEREIPLKASAPVHLTGVSWKPASKQEWTRHDFGEIAPKTASWDSSGSDHSGVYLRFGDWPHDERSFSPASGYHEEGVSAYDLDRDGDPSIDHGLNRGHREHTDECDVDENGTCQFQDPWGEPDNDPQEEMRGRTTRAERSRYYGSDKPSEVGHLVRGEMSGVGYDGEPLLKNVKRVGDWIDHRHLFLDQAGPHRLARSPHDEDYEEPEEKPPYGDHHRTAALESQDYWLDHRPPGPGHTSQSGRPQPSVPYHEAAGRDPEDLVDVYRGAPDGTDKINQGDWVTLHGDWARDRGPNVLHARVPARHVYLDAKERDDDEAGYHGPAVAAMPKTAATHPWHGWAIDQPHKAVIWHAQSRVRDDHPELTAPLPPPDAEGFSAEGHSLLKRALTAGGYPPGRADRSFVLAHGAPDENGTSQVAMIGSRMGIALHPRSWDSGTVAHEAAHLLDISQHGRDPVQAARVPDEEMHGPEFAGHYATALNAISPGAGDDFLRHHADSMALVGNFRYRVHGLPREYPGSEPMQREASSGLSFRYEGPRHEGDRHVITVHHPDAQRETRSGPSDVAGSVQWDDDGLIRDVSVHPDFRRRGIATELFRRAQQVTPHLRHADSPSPDGVKWIEGMGREATTSGGVPQRPKRTPGSAMVYLDVPHGTVEPYEGQEGGHHVALAYLPRSIGDEDFERVKQRAREAAARHAPMKATVGGGEVFPPGTPSDRRRVAVVPVHAPGIHELHREFSEFDRAHYDTYTPHVTRAQLGGHQVNPPPHPEASFPVTHLHVRRGDEVHSFPLTGRGRIEREAAAEEEPKTYYHVSYARFPRGHMLTPQGAGQVNFPGQSSGEHVYMTGDRDHAETYRYHLWEQGYPEQHLYEVSPHGPVEPDPHDEQAVRTRHPVEVTWHENADDEDDHDWFHHREAAAEDEGVPDVLYHGTTPERAESIDREGLVPQHREFATGRVFLTEDPEEAKSWVRSMNLPFPGRALLDPVVYEVRHKSGVERHHVDGSWVTSEPIPPGHIRRHAVSGYDGLTGRSGMIYLDLPPGAVRQVPGGVDDHHVTLVYLGKNVSDEAFEEACRRTKAAAAKLTPMDGVLRGIDVFPPSKGSDGKVVAFVPAYVGSVGLLRRELEDLSASEHKDYRPHVTLAYLEEGDSLPAPHPAVPLHFDRVHVKRGDDIRSYPLGGGMAREAAAGGEPTADQLSEITGFRDALRKKNRRGVRDWRCESTSLHAEKVHGYPAVFGDNGGFHVWNSLPDGRILDATADQLGHKEDSGVRIVHPDHPDFEKYRPAPDQARERQFSESRARMAEILGGMMVSFPLTGPGGPDDTDG